MLLLVSAARQVEIPGDAREAQRGVWIDRETLRELTGWSLRPEGLCRGDACVPLSRNLAKRFVDGDRVDAAGLWHALGRPVLHDDACETWMLGEAAEDRERQLQSLEAPDFTLPDLAGRMHSLSDYRGSKVLLATWASW